MFVAGWGVRRLLALTRALPGDSATAHAMGRAWTTQNELTASLVDAVNVHIVVALRVAGGKNVADPQRIPRPGDRDERPKFATRMDYRRALMGGT